MARVDNLAKKCATQVRETPRTIHCRLNHGIAFPHQTISYMRNSLVKVAEDYERDSWSSPPAPGELCMSIFQPWSEAPFRKYIL